MFERIDSSHVMRFAVVIGQTPSQKRLAFDAGCAAFRAMLHFFHKGLRLSDNAVRAGAVAFVTREIIARSTYVVAAATAVILRLLNASSPTRVPKRHRVSAAPRKGRLLC